MKEVEVLVDDPDQGGRVAEIELFEDGKCVAAHEPGNPSPKWVMKSKSEAGSQFYFVKVTEADGGKLWSSTSAEDTPAIPPLQVRFVERSARPSRPAYPRTLTSAGGRTGTNRLRRLVPVAFGLPPGSLGGGFLEHLTDGPTPVFQRLRPPRNHP